MAEIVVGNVKVVTESEVAISNHPGRVLVHIDGRLAVAVAAKIEKQQGADGGYYDCIILHATAVQ